MDFSGGFGMANRDDGRTQKPGGVEALLPAVVAGILDRADRVVKNLFGIGKIEPVFFQVGLPFALMLGEVHALNYTYSNMYSNAPLASHSLPAYPVPASAKSEVGRRKPVESKRRISAVLQALFSCLQSLYGERCGAVARLAGVLLSRRKEVGELQGFSKRSLSCLVRPLSLPSMPLLCPF